MLTGGNAPPGCSVKFVKVDTDSAAMKPIAERLGVTALPAFRFFKDGKEVHDPVTGYKKSLLEAAVKTM